MNPQKSILVVDDDPDILEQVGLILGHEGFRVVTAGGREEGEGQLLAFRPDLAILDLMMEHPDSGFVLCHHIKKLYPETPVILLTAVTAQTGISFDSQSSSGRSWVKADQILDKPVRSEQLLSEVRRLLKLEAPTPAHH
jgi:DNA-binding response OmpR family regulator